jgi:hypothetical protein
MYDILMSPQISLKMHFSMERSVHRHFDLRGREGVPAIFVAHLQILPLDCVPRNAFTICCDAGLNTLPGTCNIMACSLICLIKGNKNHDNIK